MKSFFCFLLLTLVVSCTTSNTIYEKPEGLIPKDTMKLLLMDMYLANSSKNIKTKFSKKYKNFLPVVYKKYKIDSTRFYNSNIYYTSKIEDYNEILKVVKDSIQARLYIYEEAMKAKDLVKKEEKERKKRLRKQNDSVKKAQRKKGYIPALRYEIKHDSVYFFDNKEFFSSTVEAYKFLVKDK